MNTNKFFAIIFAFALITSMPSYAIAPGESIDFDPRTGDYMINYMGWSADGTPVMQHVRFVPATKIEPTVKSRFALGRDGAITYSYSIVSGAKSRQPLTSMVFDPVSSIKASMSLPKTWKEHDRKLMRAVSTASKSALLTPSGWDGDINPSDVGGHRISWIFLNLVTNNDGLQPGQSQGGFGFASLDLPGMGVAELDGNSPTIGFPDEGPDGEISNQHQKLLQNDFVTRPAVIPTITDPNPFDAAVLLDSIRTQVATWPSKKLLDPAFAAQLDRYMAAAADAYRHNQPKAGKEHIESLRKLLEHEHRFLDHDDEDNDDTAEHKTATRLTIDRLAARVLDFDLRYVLKRMEKEHEHEHDEGDHRKER
jgi:hypothetical protein